MSHPACMLLVSERKLIIFYSPSCRTNLFPILLVDEREGINLLSFILVLCRTKYRLPVS